MNSGHSNNVCLHWSHFSCLLLITIALIKQVTQALLTLCVCLYIFSHAILASQKLGMSQHQAVSLQQKL